MTDESFQDDPFSPTALDEATEFRALSNALQLAQDFKLIFSRCNQSDQRNRLVAKLRSELPSLNIQEIHFIEPITHLLDALRARIVRPAPTAVFVSGLEYSLPSAEEAPASPFVANLNASRNSFPDVIGCSLVLWTPEYILNAIMIGAPDFFSIRSGVYFFAAGPGETADLEQALTGGGESSVGSLNRAEKEERVKAIESLLADYESLPMGNRDLKAEMRLRLRLGNLYRMLGSYDTARVCFQKALDQAKKSGSLSYESVACTGLGIVYRYLGKWSEAKAVFERGLEISRETGHRLGEAADLRNIGNVHFNLREWEDARECYERSLEIIREIGDKLQEGQALTNLGNVLRRQGGNSEAEDLYKKALQIASETGDRSGQQIALQSLGALYSDEGRLLEAQEAYQQSLEIASQLGDAEGAWMTLHNQSLLREGQGDFVGAKDFEKQAVEILSKIKAKELSSELSRLANLERKAKEQEEAQEQPA
jgi:tetratricopeptide (TPR) repeat protein